MTEKLLLAQVSVDIRDLQKQMQKAGFSVETAGRRMASNWKSSTSSMTRDTEQFSRDVRRAISAIALTAAAGEIASLADAWTTAGNQISAAAAVTGDAGIGLSTIADIARDTRTEFEATATLYARLTRATADLGASQEQVIEATRLVNQAFVAGGASANEQASAVLQLSQALQSGALQGDELKSLRESSPILLAAIAKEFGVAQGALKALGAEGKLTSDRIFKAILQAAPEIEAQFSVTQATIADSFTNLRTAAIEYVGSLNSSLGVTDGFSKVVNHLADNFETFADALLISAALLGARGLGGALQKAGVDFAKYAGGITARRREMIAIAEREKDAAAARAREAAQNVHTEAEQLAVIQKARQEAAQAITGDDRAIIQRRNLAKATAEVKAAEQDLTRVQLSKTATDAQREEATRRLTIAQGNLAAVERARVPNMERANTLETQEIATTQRLTAAKIASAEATRALSIASATLVRLQQPLLNAGRALLNLFGGPVGLAFTAAAAATAYFYTEQQNAERAIVATNSALEILAEGYSASEGLARDAAGASAELTAELKAQKDAAEALAEIQRQERRDTYIKGLEEARATVERLKKEIAGATGETINLSNALKYNAFTPKDEFNEKLEKARDDLASMTRYVAILEAGLTGLQAINFERPKVSTEIESPTRSAETETDMEARLKAEAAAAKTAAEEAKRLVDGIREAWGGYYEWKDEAIARELAETLEAIDKAALSAEAKTEARTLAEQTAAAKRSEIIADEMADYDELQKAKDDAARNEMDLVSRVLNERDAMLGRTLSIIAREYEERRKYHNATIADETRRNEALAALAEEEAEFRRQARLQAFELDERSDVGSQIAAQEELNAAKLVALEESLSNELIKLAEYEALKREIIADNEAEIQAIRAASAQVQLAGASSLFGSLASLASTFAGESSSIFKALFLAEKAAALASAYVNMQLAIAKANASAPPPFNAPAILSAKITGAAAIAGILASTAAGFKKGGYTGDGDPNSVAGAVHKGEYVFDAKATRRLGKGTLEALRSGKVAPQTIASPVSAAGGRSVSFGDMNVSISGNGADEIRDELASALAAHRRQIATDVERNFSSQMSREIKQTTPRHERPRT